MKIVDICEFYSPHGGGVRTYLERKLAVGAAQGHEIVLVAPGKRSHVEQRPCGGRIVFVEAPPLPFDRRYRMFWDAASVHDVLDREQPDIVEASSPWRGAWLAATWSGPAPRALVMHADPLAAYAYRWFRGVADRSTIDRHFDWFWRYLRRLGDHFDMVVSAGRSLSSRLVNGGVSGVLTVPMGVDPNIFSPLRRDTLLRAELLARCDLDASASLLLGVGRHSPEKRWPLVIDACLAASAERPIGLVLVGDGRDRQKIVRHVGGNPHVHLVAPVTDRLLLAKLMASADALIHGCECETFGLVAAEAVASGLPLIVPDEGGASDMADTEHAECYRAGDARSAAAAVLRLLGRDPVKLKAHALRAAAEVRTMDSHLLDLFHRYGALDGSMRSAA